MGEQQRYNNSWSAYQLGRGLKVAVGDVNGNGTPDIVAGSREGLLFIFEWNGRTFRRREVITVGRPVEVISLGDTNGDGILDIIVGTNAGVQVWEWSGVDFIQVFQSERVGRITSIAAADFNNDGRDDFAVSIGSSVLVYAFTGAGFELIDELIFDSRVLVGAGDTSGSGRADLVVAFVGNNRVSVYRWTGLQFVETRSVVLESSVAGPVLVGDVTGDFREDIILGIATGTRFAVLEQRATLREIFSSSSLGGRIVGFAAGDWNNDGRNDLIAATSRNIFIYEWNGRTFVELARLGVEGTISDVAAGDVNNDGQLEIVAATNQGNIFVLREEVRADGSQFLVQQELTIPRRLPDAIKIAEVRVDRVIIEDVDVIPNKVIVRGEFVVSVLYVGRPDRRVFEFDARVPFVHFIEVPGIRRVRPIDVDVEVEFVNSRFDPRSPRELEVVIVAEVVLFDFVVKERDTLITIAQQFNTTVEEIKKINGLSGNQAFAGQKLKIPF